MARSGVLISVLTLVFHDAFAVHDPLMRREMSRQSSMSVNSASNLAPPSPGLIQSPPALAELSSGSAQDQASLIDYWRRMKESLMDEQFCDVDFVWGVTNTQSCDYRAKLLGPKNRSDVSPNKCAYGAKRAGAMVNTHRQFINPERADSHPFGCFMYPCGNVSEGSQCYWFNDETAPRHEMKDFPCTETPEPGCAEPGVPCMYDNRCNLGQPHGCSSHPHETKCRYCNAPGYPDCFPPGSQTVLTCGGTGEGSSCVFPFEHAGHSHNTCISEGHPEPWCVTSNGGWGYCECGRAPQEFIGTRCGYHHLDNFISCVFPFESDGAEINDCSLGWCFTDAAQTQWTNQCVCEHYEESTLGLATCNGNAQGARCKFPFSAGDTSYNACTNVGHDKDWCYTEAGSHLWGECDCAGEETGTNAGGTYVLHGELPSLMGVPVCQRARYLFGHTIPNADYKDPRLCTDVPSGDPSVLGEYKLIDNEYDCMSAALCINKPTPVQFRTGYHNRTDQLSAPPGCHLKNISGVTHVMFNPLGIVSGSIGTAPFWPEGSPICKAAHTDHTNALPAGYDVSQYIYDLTFR